MVNFALSFGTAVLAAQIAFAAPSVKRADSAIGQEVAVSAPDGIPITDTEELASQSAEEAQSKAQAYGDETTSADVAAYTTDAYDTAAAYQTDTAVYDTSSAVWETSADVYETTNAYDTAVYETSSAEDTAVYETSSVEETAVYETSSVEETAVYETSSAVYETTVAYETSSAVYDTAAATATYGSGSSGWDNDNYNDCVQQCVATFGAPPAAYTPPSSTVEGEGSVGTGATHTVIVAPSQGVLRYVPFATNASVGDTVKFIWNANMHTVSKSSQLELCNKTSDQPFTSGVQNQSFVFTQVVNTTDPTFLYCSVGTHCQQGMFGIINPPSADVAADSSNADTWAGLISNNSQVAAWDAYTQNATKDNEKAASWGSSIEMASLPEWAHQSTAENIMYTRTFLAANPDVFTEDGSIDLGATGDAPFQVPQDLNTALAATDSGSSAAADPSATGADVSGSSADPEATAASASGARGITASFGLASIVALGAALFAL